MTQEKIIVTFRGQECQLVTTGLKYVKYHLVSKRTTYHVIQSQNNPSGSIVQQATWRCRTVGFLFDKGGGNFVECSTQPGSLKK